jgi:hypothetical protein
MTDNRTFDINNRPLRDRLQQSLSLQLTKPAVLGWHVGDQEQHSFQIVAAIGRFSLHMAVITPLLISQSAGSRQHTLLRLGNQSEMLRISPR